jgi:hypothetical protein
MGTDAADLGSRPHNDVAKLVVGVNTKLNLFAILGD